MATIGIVLIALAIFTMAFSLAVFITVTIGPKSYETVPLKHSAVVPTFLVKPLSPGFRECPGAPVKQRPLSLFFRPHDPVASTLNKKHDDGLKKVCS